MFNKLSKFTAIICFLFTVFSNLLFGQFTGKRTTVLMGAKFEFTLVAKDSITAENLIDTAIQEVKRIEYLLSDWIDTTPISRINQYAGIQPVKVNNEVLAITQKAKHWSHITQGAFDISFATTEKIWKYDGSMTAAPSAKAIRNARRYINYKNIIIDTNLSTIFLKYKGMKIGFGALGEGYAIDRCKNILQNKGIKAGLINGSGDIISWGTQLNGEPWKVGITNPHKPSQLLAIIPLKQGAITTSGSYEKYIEIDNKRYSHIINPKTGIPVTELISVTVLGPHAETANALSTSIMVLGKVKGIKLLDKYPNYSAIIVDKNGNITTYPHFDLTPYLVNNQ